MEAAASECGECVVVTVAEVVSPRRCTDQSLYWSLGVVMCHCLELQQQLQQPAHQHAVLSPSVTRSHSDDRLAVTSLARV